ncbi:MAG: type IV pilus modification PilV family protein [Limisphaerales bacterium]|jgi:prepilin-type N-terminal cleavage/methylation domain-containing protein|nr:prepilin-type N-terminal cleavage/methylation domain-containing protein [Verrucomicrobiota bacterium]
MNLCRHRAPKPTGKLHGFSLIETLIGVVIVGISVLAVTGGIHFCLGILQSNRQWARSTDILLDMAERLSLVRWEVIEAEAFPKTFTALLYPELSNTNTNEMAGTSPSPDPPARARGSLRPTPFEPDSQTNDLEKLNIVFQGLVELQPFLGTNNVGYNEHLRHALITVTWENNGRFFTNSLKVNLSKNNITSFQEHPAKTPAPELEWSSAQEILDSLKEEKE